MKLHTWDIIIFFINILCFRSFVVENLKCNNQTTTSVSTLNCKFTHISKSPLYSPCLGNCSASLRRLVRLSAPSWLRIPGSISVSCLVSAWPVMANVLADKDACTLGLLKWMTVPSSLIIFTCKTRSNSQCPLNGTEWDQQRKKLENFCSTSSMPAMLLTASFFNELWSFLSSAVAVLCTTFFFLRAVPYGKQIKTETQQQKIPQQHQNKCSKSLKDVHFKMKITQNFTHLGVNDFLLSDEHKSKKY